MKKATLLQLIEKAQYKAKSHITDYFDDEKEQLAAYIAIDQIVLDLLGSLIECEGE